MQLAQCPHQFFRAMAQCAESLGGNLERRPRAAAFGAQSIEQILHEARIQDGVVDRTGTGKRLTASRGELVDHGPVRTGADEDEMAGSVRSWVDCVAG